MPRRADNTREELNEMVVESARRRIAADGVESLTARAIASDIGYAVGTLYHHFENLDAIVTAVNARTLLGLGAAFANAAKSDNPSEMLHNYADAFLGYIHDNPRLWNALFEFKRAAGVQVPEWYVGSIARLVDVIADCFRRIDPSATHRHCVEAGQLVFASVHSVCSLENSGRLALIMDQDIRTVVHRLVDLHIAGFSTNPGPQTPACH